MKNTFCEKYPVERKKILDIADTINNRKWKIVMEVMIRGLDDYYFHKKNNENVLAVVPKT